MKIKWIAFLGSLAFLGFVACGTDAQANSENIVQKEFRYFGNGCPQGTADGLVNSEGDFEILMTNFEAVASPEAPGAATQCQFIVKINVPRGQTFRIGSMTVQGMGLQQNGSHAYLRATYGYMGMPQEVYKWDLDLPEVLTEISVFGEPKQFDWPKFCGGEVEIRGSLGALVRRSVDGANAEIYLQNTIGSTPSKVLWDWQTAPCEGN
jgi:hypothetical protein